MNKQQFLDAVRTQVSSLPELSMQRSLEFYEEMINDRIEDGMTEEEAVAALGSPEEIAAQIKMDTPLLKLVSASVRPKRRLQIWEIVLLILGAPLWAPLLLAAVIILLAVYVVIWSVAVVLYAADLSLAAGLLAGVYAGVLLLNMGELLQAVLFFGAGLVCGGIAIVLFLGCNQMSRGIVKGSHWLFVRLKERFVRKGAVV